MVNNQFMRQFIGMSDELFLNQARDYITGKTQTLTVTDAGRTYRLIRVETTLPESVIEQLTSQAIMLRVLDTWKNNKAVLEDTSGIKPKITGTKSALEAYRNQSGAPEAEADLAEVTAEEIEEAKDAAIKEEKTDDKSKPEGRHAAHEQSVKGIKAQFKATVQTRPAGTSLILAKAIGKVIEKVIRMREEKAIEEKREYVKEKKKTEQLADKEHHRVVKEEVKRQNVRIDLSKSEKAKKSPS